jgi:hypothetical protein
MMLRIGDIEYNRKDRQGFATWTREKFLCDLSAYLAFSASVFMHVRISTMFFRLV